MTRELFLLRCLTDRDYLALQHRHCAVQNYRRLAVWRKKVGIAAAARRGVRGASVDSRPELDARHSAVETHRMHASDPPENSLARPPPRRLFLPPVSTCNYPTPETSLPHLDIIRGTVTIANRRYRLIHIV